MRRYFLIVLDGCGVGAMPDAAEYGVDDPVSNTLGHVADAVGGLRMPHLESLGLGNIVSLRGIAPQSDAPSAWGKACVRSKGKDSVTGHWEMAGIQLDTPFPTWPDGIPTDLLERVAEATGVQFLGGHPSSGTVILELLGDEHVKTGKPIAYTSADSVFQIAAHEEQFGLERLYTLCETARRLVPACRVIARPFLGSKRGGFRRTGNRRDWPMAPPSPNVLEHLGTAGIRTHFIGRPAEFFREIAHQTRELTTDNTAHASALARLLAGQGPGADARFVFVNFEDFDMLCGHRNDPAGFAGLLEDFDRFLGETVLPGLSPGDRVGITADHGNDPTTPSTDHSREYVPVLLFGKDPLGPRDLGIRQSLADWSADIAGWLGAPGWAGPGRVML